MKLKKLTELALLTAVALIIFIIELRFPDMIPIAGVKLGLANIITVYAVFHYKPNETAMLVFCRVLLGAIFGANLTALFYSLSGAILCLFGMLIIKKFIPENYIWLCSILGAVLHNIGQILVAMLVTRTILVISYLPILIISGCIAGLFTGLCAQMLIKRLEK
ncbi:MAG: Gx transporter family protein [Oscillospiraceae bacterium]|nr:Gx transporter family protein [Oscillospiraceae bacterium]